jgi:hypothetical protein
MFRDFSQRGEKVSTAHSVQKDVTIEDMGRSVSRIYAALDKKKAKFSSHMIEVEGNINEQFVSILIDLGATHSYLDPNMLERFKLSRSKLGKPWLV